MSVKKVIITFPRKHKRTSTDTSFKDLFDIVELLQIV